MITGINGYLGSKLARKYSKEYKVIGLEYDVSDLFRLKGESFEVFESRNGIPDEIFNIHKIDYIIHTATFYGRNNESNCKMNYANVYLPHLLLDKAIYYGCELFINTDTVLDRFTSSYALTKKQFGDWLKFYTELKQIKVINLKLEHFYGPGTSDTNFLTLMIKKMLNNDPEIPLTEAEQNRDFLYIDDLLRVYDVILKNQDGFDYFEEFNVGSGINVNLKEILQFLKNQTNSTSDLQFGKVPYRLNELMESNNNINRLLNLGWKPIIGVKEGLINVVSYEKKMMN